MEINNNILLGAQEVLDRAFKHNELERRKPVE
jgi:hypothetical protein